jgi:SET domain-containing protein
MNKKILKQKDVAARRSSAGLGLFALRNFKKGERIIEYVGKKVTPDSVENRYIFAVNKKWDIDGSPRQNTARYANHSCAPNAEAVNDDDRIFIEALKRIGIGEEITYDYGADHFENIIIAKNGGCSCMKCLSKNLKKK